MNCLWFWYGMNHFWFALLLMVVLVPGIARVCVRLAGISAPRVTGVYLSIMTQAMTYALLLAFFRNEMGFGGNNGLTDFKDIIGFSLTDDATRAALFLITAVVLCLAYLVCRVIVGSKLGRVAVAIRDAEMRTRFGGGYRVNISNWRSLCSLPCWQGSLALCMCHRLALSIRVNFAAELH